MKGTLRIRMVQYKTLQNTKPRPNVLVANSFIESDAILISAVLKKVMDLL
jgi:hypothetical protein